MQIREEIEIHAPLPTVWNIFSCIEEWEHWNTVCRSCCYMEGSALTAGSCIAFTIHPFSIPIRITPKVIRCTPGKELVWEGSRLGVHAKHRFLFREEKDRVILTSIEVFRGLMARLSRLVLVPSRLHQLTRELLEAVKEEAESRSLQSSSRQS
jgi:hypothetical protein